MNLQIDEILYDASYAKNRVVTDYKVNREVKRIQNSQFNPPILVKKENNRYYLIDSGVTLEAYRKLGYEQIPVFEIESESSVKDLITEADRSKNRFSSKNLLERYIVEFDKSVLRDKKHKEAIDWFQRAFPIEKLEYIVNIGGNLSDIELVKALVEYYNLKDRRVEEELYDFIIKNDLYTRIKDWMRFELPLEGLVKCMKDNTELPVIWEAIMIYSPQEKSL